MAVWKDVVSKTVEVVEFCPKKRRKVLLWDCLECGYYVRHEDFKKVECNFPKATKRRKV